LPLAALGNSNDTGPASFRKIKLNPDFYSEGITAGDLDRDGKPDIIAGPYWYPGPDFAKRLAFRQPRPVPFDSAVDSDCYAVFAYDFNQDGWPDILAFRQGSGTEAVWYENPKGAAGYWAEHSVFTKVHDESAALGDIDGDGKPEILTVSEGYGGFVQPDWGAPAAPWTFRAVTAKGTWAMFTHGIGTGDVNKDGRRDLLLPEGWWERPAAKDGAWIKHAEAFWGKELTGESYGGAQMYAYDVDGDGDNDVVTSLQAHGWGLAWFEHNDTGFVKRTIMGSRKDEAQYGAAFAQLHALAMGDLDGDGLQDLITGKRRGAHGGGLGAELDSPAVLYWFRLTRPAGQAPKYIPYRIDAEAGIGTQVTVADVNGDGAPDILTAGRHGAFAFLNTTPSAALLAPARRRGAAGETGLWLSDGLPEGPWDARGRFHPSPPPR
jgi:hypothetical protein